MAVAPVRRVYLLAHRDTADGLLSRLQDAALVHLEPLAEAEDAGSLLPVEAESRDLERRLAEVDGAIRYLARFEPPSGFLASLAGGRLELSNERFRSWSAGERVDTVLDQVREAQQKQADLEVRRARIVSALQHFAPWTTLDIPVPELTASANVVILCGTLPTASVAELRSALEAEGDSWFLEEIGSGGGKSQVVLVDLRDEKPEAETLLREAGFQPVFFPETEGTLGDWVDEQRHELERIDAEQEEIAARLATLAPERVKLMAAYDLLAQKQQQAEATAALGATRDTVVIPGWARGDDLPRLRGIAADLSPGAALIDREPAPDEEPPVVLDNAPVVRPFQVVTDLYGLPKSREIDPTPLFAPFFVLSFGIAVGEGGYGVLLALLSRLGLRFLRLSEGGRQLLTLLFYCGIATFVAGLLMGSFFAIDFPALPAYLQPVARLHAAVKQLDPLEDSLLFLGIVMGIGFLQVWLGVLVSAILKWRAGDRRTAVFHEGAWLALLLLTIPLALGKKILGMPALYPWLAAAASIFVSAGFRARGLGAKIGSGVYALYGLTGFFGDILSYSRLFALGLATGVIAMVVNILAGMARGIPLVGWIVMLLVLVFGHLFNLAINALGAFIHTARLQFVEFFTKFFEGGGRRFVPFSRKFRFTTIVDPSQAEGGSSVPGE